MYNVLVLLRIYDSIELGTVRDYTEVHNPVWSVVCTMNFPFTFTGSLYSGTLTVCFSNRLTSVLYCTCEAVRSVC